MKRLLAAILPLYSILAAYPAYAATAKPGARATQEAVVLGIIDFGNEGSKNVVTAPTTVAGSINPATTVRFPAYCR